MKALFVLPLLVGSLLAAEPPPPRDAAHESVRNEVETAITKGLAYLKAQQQADGTFRNPLIPDAPPDHPALTALPLMAFFHDPSGRAGSDYAELLRKGRAYLRGKAQPDGGIYSRSLSNYNTAVCLMALLNSGDPQDEPVILAARRFLGGQQASGMVNPETDGGFGYGPVGASAKRQHPDLDNTVIALEAIKAFAKARPAAELAAGKDLNWQAAIDFVSRCQNLPSHNPLKWASDDPQNKGGFIYYPGVSNAETMDLPDGKQALRSYGTMSYAGLLSFIYADVKKDDPRVQAALSWLEKNYALDENPGLGRQGLYYYYHLAAKGLASAGIRDFVGADGRKIDWAHDFALKLMSLQNANGSWVNDTSRWMEQDPILVTSYGVLTLEIIHHQL